MVAGIHRPQAPLHLSALAKAAALLVSTVLGCSGGRASSSPSELSPGVVFPHAIAEGHGDDPEPGAERLPKPPTGPVASAAPSASAAQPVGSAAADAAPAPSASASAPAGGPPDPEPLRLSDQWEYDLLYDAGKLVVSATRARHFKAPVVTARRIGRFAIELWIGRELVERVRFDFPGLGLESPPDEIQGTRKPLYPPANFSKGVHVRQTVLVPAAPRARRAVLLDRATGESQPLPWPPDQPLVEPQPPPS